MGDAEAGPVRLSFNPQLRVEFRGATVTSDAGLLVPASWTSASTDTRSGSSRPGAPDPACPVLHPPACPCDAFRAAERARGSSRGSFSNARERGLGFKSQIPGLNPRATAAAGGGVTCQSHGGEYACINSPH